MSVVVKIEEERHISAFRREKDSSALGHLGKGSVAEDAKEAAYGSWSSSPSLARARW